MSMLLLEYLPGGDLGRTLTLTLNLALPLTLAPAPYP